MRKEKWQRDAEIARLYIQLNFSSVGYIGVKVL